MWAQQRQAQEEFQKQAQIQGQQVAPPPPLPPETDHKQPPPPDDHCNELYNTDHVPQGEHINDRYVEQETNSRQPVHFHEGHSLHNWNNDGNYEHHVESGGGQAEVYDYGHQGHGQHPVSEWSNDHDRQEWNNSRAHYDKQSFHRNSREFRDHYHRDNDNDEQSSYQERYDDRGLEYNSKHGHQEDANYHHGQYDGDWEQHEQHEGDWEQHEQHEGDWEQNPGQMLSEFPPQNFDYNHAGSNEYRQQPFYQQVPTGAPFFQGGGNKHGKFTPSGPQMPTMPNADSDLMGTFC